MTHYPEIHFQFALNLMLNKLDQYLIRQFWIILGLSVLGFVSIFVIVDLIENLDRFMDNQVPAAAVSYTHLTLPTKA